MDSGGRNTYIRRLSVRHSGGSELVPLGGEGFSYSATEDATVGLAVVEWRGRVSEIQPATIIGVP